MRPAPADVGPHLVNRLLTINKAVVSILLVLVCLLSNCSSTHEELNAKNKHAYQKNHVDSKGNLKLNGSSKKINGINSGNVASSNYANSSTTTGLNPQSSLTQGGNLKNQNPLEIIEKSRQSAENYQSISYSESFSFNSSATNLTATITGLAQATSGVQQVNSSAGNITIIQINSSTIFVMGDSGGLSTYLGFSESDANKYQNEWIQLINGDSVFYSLTQNMSTGSLLLQIYPVAPYSNVGYVSYNNQNLIEIKGYTGINQPGQSINTGQIPETTYLNPNSYLPVISVATFSSNSEALDDEIHITKFGAQQSISAPSQYISCGVIASCS